jgi:hypothetical protein
MANVTTIEAAMGRSPASVKYADVRKVCVHHFGEPRQESTSHAVFKTPWEGLPRVNIQPDRRNKAMAKAYQVRQVVQAIDRLNREISQLKQEEER